MRFEAPAGFSGGQDLKAVLEGMGFEDVRVVYFEDGTVDVECADMSGEDEAVIEAAVAAFRPPPPAAPVPLPAPVPQVAAEFDRLLDHLVATRVLSEGQRRKIKDGG